jgi:hypothetical protein
MPADEFPPANGVPPMPPPWGPGGIPNVAGMGVAALTDMPPPPPQHMLPPPLLPPLAVMQQLHHQMHLPFLQQVPQVPGHFPPQMLGASQPAHQGWHHAPYQGGHGAPPPGDLMFFVSAGSRPGDATIGAAGRSGQCDSLWQQQMHQQHAVEHELHQPFRHHPSQPPAGDERPLYARPCGDDSDDVPPAAKRHAGDNRQGKPTARPQQRGTLRGSDGGGESAGPAPPPPPVEPAEEDGDDDGDNHLTKFNELCQRGIAGLRTPKYNYINLGPRAGTSLKWQCTATTAAKGPGDSEPVTLSQVVVGKNKKDARRIAARQLLAELVEREFLTQAVVDSKGTFAPPSARGQGSGSGNGQLTAAEARDIAAAVSILNQLWQKENFTCKPKWVNAPVSSGATGRWRCTLLIRTRKFGDVEVESVLSQKKQARQMAAHLAVQKLRQMGFPGIDDINVHAKPQANVMARPPLSDDSDGSSDDGRAPARTLNDATRRRLDTEVESDGELPPAAGAGAASSGFGSLFGVPADAVVVIAKSIRECGEWVADNAADGTTLGVYLDSHSVRESFKSCAEGAGVDVESSAFLGNECRVIGLSTGKSTLLVAAHLLGDARAAAAAEAEPASGGGDEAVKPETPAAAVNGPVANRPQEARCWVPKPVRFVLERKECVKYGVGVEEGVIALRVCHGIQCRGLHELSVLSVALMGAPTKRSRILPSPRELVHDWLNQRLSPFSKASLKSVDGLAALVEATEDVVAPAIPAAIACSLIQRRVQETAESRRRKRYTNREEYMELCNRLCLPPTAPTGLWRL